VAVPIAIAGFALARAAPVHTYGARVLHVIVNSRYVHARMPLTIVLPAGTRRDRPLLIFLHGRGGNQNSELSTPMFAALRSLGRAAPDIAFPDGGDHSYWHNRHGGAWGSYVLREVLSKAIEVAHADPRRLAIGGLSMGGFGAYNLARLDPGRFCAIGADSAAVWPTASATAPGAFDDQADFAANNIIALARANPALYGNARLWLDGGDQDPFHAADEQLAAALHIRMHVWPGGHDFDYWNAHWPEYLRFYATALAACR
jgi:S-formylglutathione hydrolase FrmB